MNRFTLAAPHTVRRFAAGSLPDKAWDNGTGEAEARPRLLSLSVPAHRLSAATFLRQSLGRERFYWAEPGDGLVLAGAGIAAAVTAPPVMRDEDGPAPPPQQRFYDVDQGARALFAGALVRQLAGAAEGLAFAAGDEVARPRLFGGFAFQDDFVPDNTWSVFNPAEFVLPHYQYARCGNVAHLIINAMVGPEEDPEATWLGLAEALRARLALADAAAPAQLRPYALRYPMTYEMWREMIQRATGAIHAGVLQKVVLARVCELRAPGSIDVAAALDYLDTAYGDSYRFLFEPRPAHAFFGATPELLVAKAGRAVTTMALAGSIARGRNATQDDTLAAQLLNSAKDRHEHQLVVDAVREHLSDMTLDLTVAPEPTVLRLRNIQHLLTPIRGRLARPEEGIVPLVRRLHPTPALGGVPSDRALALLRHAEPVPRGWYAAPVGWLDSALDGVFAVAIRSAVTQHDRAWLYAGAGIVGESLPEREWAETALKFRPMLGALGAEELE